MTDIFQGDPAILITKNGATLVFNGGDPVRDQGLENQALISLFTDSGWPGNHLFDDPNHKIGGDFEKLARGPITLSKLALIEKTAEKQLASPVFGTVRAIATNPESWRTDVEITIEPPGGNKTTILLTSNGQNWISQADNPAHATTANTQPEQPKQNYFRATTDIYEDTFLVLDGWQDLDTGSGQSQLSVDGDGVSVLQMLGSVPGVGSSTAERFKNTGDMPDDTVAVSYLVNYIHELASTNGNGQSIQIFNDDGSKGIEIQVGLLGAYYRNVSSGWSAIPGSTPVADGDEVEWGIEINWSNLTFDFYKNGVLVAEDLVGWVGTTSGLGGGIRLIQYHANSVSVVFEHLVKHLWIGKQMLEQSLPIGG